MFSGTPRFAWRFREKTGEIFFARNGSRQAGKTPSRQVLSDRLRVPNRLLGPVEDTERSGRMQDRAQGKCSAFYRDGKALFRSTKILNVLDIFR
jgi:hypothetical protein